MSLADFNKDNPFIIIMRKTEDDLYKSAMKLTKYVSIYTVCAVVLSFIITLVTKDFSLIIFSIFSIMYNVLTWRSVISKSEFTNINKIIYGEEFSAIVVNNEKLFEIILSMNIAKGELKKFNTKINYDIAIFVTIAIYSIIIKLF